MKNICYFNSIKFWGGGEKLHLEYAIAFKNKNYTVFLLANPNAPLSQKAELENIPVFPVTIGNLSFLNPIKLIRIARFFRREEIDTVIFSTSQDMKAAGLAAKLAGVRNIVYLRGLAVPIKASWINRFIFNKILTHIVANSEETKRNILKYLGKFVTKNNINVIYHGIDIAESLTDKNYTLPIIKQQGKGIILGNAGRLTPQKGHTKLLKIAKILKDQQIEFTMFIAGEGEMRPALEKLIAEYKLQKEVILTGFVENMEGFMQFIDIFLLTSDWEGFGYVLVEAMNKAKPVVAFNITSNPEIVEADRSGFLIDHPNVELFAEKTALLINDEALRLKMGKAGKESVARRFALCDRIDEFEACLLEVNGR